MKVGQRRLGTLNEGLAVAISGTVVVDAVGMGLTPQAQMGVGGGSGVPPKPPGVQADKPADLKSDKGVKQFREAAGKDVPKKIVDTFQRAGPALEAKLQSLNSAALAQKLREALTE